MRFAKQNLGNFRKIKKKEIAHFKPSKKMKGKKREKKNRDDIKLKYELSRKYIEDNMGKKKIIY